MHNNEQVNLLIDVLVVNHIEVCRAVCRPGGNRAGGDIIGKKLQIRGPGAGSAGTRQVPSGHVIPFRG